MRYLFGDFSLDTTRYELRRAGWPCPLEPQVFDVLAYLLQHRDRIVAKQELLDQLWPDRFVGEGTLTQRLMQVRKALGDTGRTQRYIQTTRGRGYRFVAAVEVASPTPLVPSFLARQPAVSNCHRSQGLAQDLGPVVGRERELTDLQQRFVQARQGERQVVFITGEPGIGKSALVETFVAQVVTTEALRVGYGQCIEQYGAGEPYLPVLEALGRLGRGPDGKELLGVLRHCAPTWLVQLPTLLTSREREALQSQTRGVTRDRMLRELAEAIEIFTAERPMILVLEDLHWSDVSTLAWLTYVARRRDPARLLVLATYRPADAMIHAHPVRTVLTELHQHRQGVELELDYVSEAAVAAYLIQRLGPKSWPAALPRVLHQRTNGHPLFLIAVVNALVSQHVLAETDTGWHLQGGGEMVARIVPASLQRFIEQQAERLSPEDQTLLEAASVAGMRFSVAAVGAGLHRANDLVEARCTTLARQHLFLQAEGMVEWPDGMATSQYSFRHELYREVLYARVPAGRRVQLHRQIGIRLEAGYAARTGDIAAELAVHFVRGRDTQRAVHYLYLAGQNALLRSAHQEAIAHLRQGLEALQTRPETSERALQELDMQVVLGTAWMATRGYAAAQVEHAYTRARALCQQVGETSRLVAVLRGLGVFYRVRGALQTAYETGEELLHLVQRHSNPVLFLWAHTALGIDLFHLGKLVSASRHLEQGILHDVAQHRSRVARGADARVGCRAYAACALWWLGYPDQALARIREALVLAQNLEHPHSLAWTLGCAAFVHQARREAHVTQEHAQAEIRLATEHGLPLWRAFGHIMWGWACLAQHQPKEGLAEIHHGITAWRGTGAELQVTHWLALLAEAYEQCGKAEDSFRVLAEAVALIDQTGERYYESELHRLQGEFLLAQSIDNHIETEMAFQKSLTISRSQHAKSLELRTATSLARLWQSQGKRGEARDLLAPIYHWFTEGFDTADLKEAKMLLEELDV